MHKSSRVLVVDDDRICRVGACLALSQAGYESRAVADGFSALRTLGEGGWDLVLTDFNMPGMNGLEVVRETKRLFPGVRVILMTGRAMDDDIQTAIDAGAACCLHKPFGVTELERCLDAVLETTEARRARDC